MNPIEMSIFVHTLTVPFPTEMTTTINNFLTGGQVLGGALAGIFLLIAGIQLMSGGKNAVEMGKWRIVCVLIGMVLVAGCTVIKSFIDGLMAF